MLVFWWLLIAAHLRQGKQHQWALSRIAPAAFRPEAHLLGSGDPASRDPATFHPGVDWFSWSLGVLAFHLFWWNGTAGMEKACHGSVTHNRCACLGASHNSL